MAAFLSGTGVVRGNCLDGQRRAQCARGGLRTSAFIGEGISAAARPAAIGRSVSEERSSRVAVVMVTPGGLKKVVVAGGSGFLGKYITKELVKLGCEEVVVLSRSNKGSEVKKVTSVKWNPVNPDAELVEVLKGADSVINLCGELIVQPWTESKKKELVDSRLLPTATLVEAMSKIDASERPKSFISSSAVGLYGISETETFTESSPAGNDFLADLCTKWEAEATKAETHGVRTVVMRNGIVLGKGGGALRIMLPVFTLALGGTLGRGDQWVSWISAVDASRAFVKAAESPGMTGSYNLTAPTPCTSKEMTDALARALKRPAIFPAPAFAIQTVFGEGATVLLDGQKVLPSRLEQDGFEFSSVTIDEVMKSVAS